MRQTPNRHDSRHPPARHPRSGTEGPPRPGPAAACGPPASRAPGLATGGTAPA